VRGAHLPCAQLFNLPGLVQGRARHLPSSRLLLRPPFFSLRQAGSKTLTGAADTSFPASAMDVAGARRSSASSAAEFQFWPLDANPTASPSCADELFAGGFLLPLPVLPPRAASHSGTRSSHVSPATEPEPKPERGDASLLPAAIAAPAVAPSAAIASLQPPAAGGSKRWTDIFSKKPADEKEKEKEKRKKPAAHAGSSGGGGGSELNINIWPYSRSRSAGGGSSKPRPPPRKASSAPCSRSNSRGEAVPGPLPPRRWAASPGRAGGGVPVGRSSPVWQIRRPAAKPTPPASDPFTGSRAATQQRKDKPSGGGRKLGGGVRGLNLSVNSCIGYRHQVSCRRVDAIAARSEGGGGGLFGIKGFFSKKVH
jgi:hypothetical protein